MNSPNEDSIRRLSPRGTAGAPAVALLAGVGALVSIVSCEGFQSDGAPTASLSSADTVGEASVDSSSSEARFDPTRVMTLGPDASKSPERVVSLSPAVTDIVVALGAVDLLVGVTRFCSGEGTRSLPRVGGYLDPSVEAVLGARPDLVIAEPSPGNREAVLRLARIGLPLLVVPHGGIDEARTATLAISRALDRESVGRRVVDEIDEALAAIVSAARERAPVRAAIVYGREPLVLAGPGSFGDEILRLAGGENIAGGAGMPYPTFPLEKLVAGAPDVVIEAAMLGADSSTPLPHMQGTRHVVIEGDGILRPGPAIPDAARRVLEALHPGLEIASARGADAHPRALGERSIR